MSTTRSDLIAFDAEAVPEDVCIRYEIYGKRVQGRGQIDGSCLDGLRATDQGRREDERR